MKKKKDGPYLLSCLIAMVNASYFAFKFNMLKIAGISSETERMLWCVAFSEILFIVLQRYLLMVFRGYKRYFDDHRHH